MTHFAPSPLASSASSLFCWTPLATKNEIHSDPGVLCPSSLRTNHQQWFPSTALTPALLLHSWHLHVLHKLVPLPPHNDLHSSLLQRLTWRTKFAYLQDASSYPYPMTCMTWGVIAWAKFLALFILLQEIMFYGKDIYENEEINTKWSFLSTKQPRLGTGRWADTLPASLTPTWLWLTRGFDFFKAFIVHDVSVQPYPGKLKSHWVTYLKTSGRKWNWLTYLSFPTVSEQI